MVSVGIIVGGCDGSSDGNIVVVFNDEDIMIIFW